MMIALEVRAPALNRLWSWTLLADRDLFGRWQAVVAYDPIGRHGQARRDAFEDEADLCRFVRRPPLRRRSAMRGIGVSYEGGGSFTFGSRSSHAIGVAVRLPSARGAWGQP